VKYRTKSRTVDAIQYKGLNIVDLEGFIGKKKLSFDGGLWLDTAQGYIPILTNDWIVRDEDGDLKVVEEHRFPHAFEPVD